MEELWQQILARLELPSTRMLLSQQAHLRQVDGRRAVVRVASNWLSMVQSRLPLLEKAIEATLGSTRQITLEASDQERPDPSPGAGQSVPTMVVPAAAPVVEPPPEVATIREAIPPAIPPLPAPAAPSPAQEAPGAPPAGGDLATVVPARKTSAAPPADPNQPEQRRLEESSHLLAEFFNGQVIGPEEEADASLPTGND